MRLTPGAGLRPSKKRSGDFLAQVTPLLLKVAKISRGQLVVSGGRIGAPGSVPERFGADDAEAVAEKQKQTIVAVLRRISQTGVTPSVALSLGKALSTLYALSDGADAFYDAYFREEKQRAAETPCVFGKAEKAAFGRTRRAEKGAGRPEGSAGKRGEEIPLWTGCRWRRITPRPVSLPVCAAEAGGMLIPRKWRLSDDGPLVVRLEDGEIADGVDFLRALIVQFLYAYPALDKQILYCSEEANRDMDNFLFALERSAEKGIFFDGMRQIEDDGARGFEYRVSEVLMSPAEEDPEPGEPPERARACGTSASITRKIRCPYSRPSSSSCSIIRSATKIAAISAISSKTGARRACSSSSCKRAKPSAGISIRMRK